MSFLLFLQGPNFPGINADHRPSLLDKVGLHWPPQAEDVERFPEALRLGDTLARPVQAINERCWRHEREFGVLD